MKLTMSGRASAAPDIDVPAPMVTASATAILNDINLSTSFGRPVAEPRKPKEKLKQILQKPLQSSRFCPRIVNRVR
jgi:hypothetical protein